ncbi:MAG: IS3 family transposase [Bacteroidia bacterium]
MEKLCRLFGKNRQSWYKATLLKESQYMKEMIVIEKVQRIRQELPRLGTEKLHICLKPFLRDHQIKMGRDKLNKLLKEAGLLVPKFKRYAKTTQSNHRFRKYENLIQELVLTRANHVWVSDITYVSIGGYFGYLSLITDAYSHKIVGWHLSKTLEAKGPIAALKMALKQRNHTGNKRDTLIHHSDRGVQYCCHAYIELLEEDDIQISMTQNGDPYENAIAERVNGIIKNEVLPHPGFPNFEQALEGIRQAIKAYNTLRPHRSCDMLTPEQAHLQQGPLKKRWTNYYQLNRQPDDERHSHKHVPPVAPPLPCKSTIAQPGRSVTEKNYLE